MSFVADRRLAALFALLGLTSVATGLWTRADGAPVEQWLTSVSLGALLCLLVADGLQRRWRGDPRVRESGPDGRTLAAGIVGFCGLTVVGLWSYAQAHDPRAWGLLAGGGLFGAATLALVWHLATSGADDWPR